MHISECRKQFGKPFKCVDGQSDPPFCSKPFECTQRGHGHPTAFSDLNKRSQLWRQNFAADRRDSGSTRYRRMQGERVHDTYTPRARTTHHAPPRYIHTHHTWNIFMHKLDSFAFPHIPLCRFTPLYSIPCNSATRLFPHPCMYPPTSMDARNDSGFVFGSQAAVAVFPGVPFCHRAQSDSQCRQQVGGSAGSNRIY